MNYIRPESNRQVTVTFRSRSATICAAYLIQEMNMDAEEAVETIRDGGDIVNLAWKRRETRSCA